MTGRYSIPQPLERQDGPSTDWRRQSDDCSISPGGPYANCLVLGRDIQIVSSAFSWW